MRERCRASGLLVGVALASCGAGAPAHAPSTEPRKAEAPPAPAARVTNVAAPVASAPPAKVHLTQDEARRRMLELINRDRATQKLPPVLLDEGPAQAAAQRHAEDMARRGFLGHWGTDGSVPEQRYTEAGGADFVQENALCFTDEKERTLDPDPRVDADAIARAESMFFDEVPPNDGHRRNILKAQHLRVGIGVAQPVGTPRERAVPCFTQEFVDAYGTYAPLPGRVKVGATLRVSGEVSGRASFAGWASRASTCPGRSRWRS